MESTLLALMNDYRALLTDEPSFYFFVNYFLADIIKKRFFPSVGHEKQKRSKDVVTFSLQTGQRQEVPESKIR